MSTVKRVSIIGTVSIESIVSTVSIVLSEYTKCHSVAYSIMSTVTKPSKRVSISVLTMLAFSGMSASEGSYESYTARLKSLCCKNEACHSPARMRCGNLKSKTCSGALLHVTT